MTMARAGTRVAVIFGLLALGLVAGLAQEAKRAGDVPPEALPFAPPKPGQVLDPGAIDSTPRELSLGHLEWAPIASRCGFTGPELAPPDMSEKQPQSFVFVTMVSDNASGPNTIERGYVMANGLVRELEKGKTAPNKDGEIVTVWRAAGEPRINVNVTLREVQETADGLEYAGAMTVFWGDKKEDIAITGRCGG